MVGNESYKAEFGTVSRRSRIIWKRLKKENTFGYMIPRFEHRFFLVRESAGQIYATGIIKRLVQ